MAISSDILNIALEESALECGCRPEDFSGAQNLCMPMPLNFETIQILIRMVSYGTNVVAAAQEELFDLMCRFLDRDGPPWLFFQADCTADITSWVRGGDPVRSSLKSCFLPTEHAFSDKKSDNKIRTVLLESNELTPLYRAEWSNAMSLNDPRSDVLAAVIYEGTEPIAVAACSRDTPSMWQIGVDVLPEYRRLGYGSAVVRRLSAEVLERGRVPFYTAASANIASIRTAYCSGYELAWTDFTVSRHIL